jgi:hypothetical protein
VCVCVWGGGEADVHICKKFCIKLLQHEITRVKLKLLKCKPA